ncbi:MAG: helix-turn-helix domain-containing protein [Planctomycetes bacterium]|nr:helix-turn-helix domain-containing protein [Planctomycetota bacterium]
MTETPEVLTIQQAAEYLQLHPQVVYRHVRAGTLPASRIGRTIRFKKSVLDEFLEKTGWEAVQAFMRFQEQHAQSTDPAAIRRRRFSMEVD